MIRHLIVALLLVPTLALAQTPTPATYWSGSVYTGASTQKTLRSQDLTGLCNSKIGMYVLHASGTPGRAYSGGRATSPTNSSGFCQFRWSDQPVTASEVSAGPWSRTICTTVKPFFDAEIGCVAVVVPPPDSCPIGGAGSAGTYDVTTGYATGPGAGSGVASKVVPDGGWPNVTFCDGVCTIKTSGTPESCHIAQMAGPNGYYKMYCTGGFQNTGSQCAVGPGNPDVASQPPEPSIPNSSSDGKCPAGTVAGGQDSRGMTICIGTAKPPAPPVVKTEKPPVTTSNPDGGSTTTQESTSSNADGSATTTTTTTVTAPDGTKTVTVSTNTTPKPAGGAGIEDKPEDKSDLCKQNPHLTICKNSQVVGQCAEVSCTGDAIQCATLRAAAAMECKAREEVKEMQASPYYALGQAAAAGNDPLKNSFPTVANAKTVQLPGSLDGSGWLGGGAPFPDKTFVVQGQTVTIPFASALQYLLILRYALMVVALLVSFRILSGAVIKGG